MTTPSKRFLFLVSAITLATAGLPSAWATTNDIVVTGRKWREPLASLPQSATVIEADDAGGRDITTTRETTRGIANMTVSEFTARRLSYPFVRGIGSGGSNPAIITCVDGIPNYSYSTADQELAGLNRVEFIRGPQSATYGRNALGGIVNIVTRQPSDEPGGDISLTAGNYNLWETRFALNGSPGTNLPLASVSGGFTRRDGYTENELTGESLDGRQAGFGRVQFLWPDLGGWSVKLSLNGETARDGDYALNDLSALRAKPHSVRHDYTGSTERDIAQAAATVARMGRAIDFTSVTAYQWWQSDDKTDLDASALDLLRRSNREEQGTLLQEFRWGSPEDAPYLLGDMLKLRWLAGLSAFGSTKDIVAHNDYRSAAKQYLGLPVTYSQYETSELEDVGVGSFARATFSIRETFDLEFGLRYDYEHKKADMRRYSAPAVTASTSSESGNDFNRLSPHNTVTWHLADDINVYASFSSGYKAGGFNSQAPAGSAEYGEETSWTVETGVKSSFFKNRLAADIALFYNEWNDIQLDVTDTNTTTFYIANAGEAASWGGEAELRLKPWSTFELTAAAGILESEFKEGSTSYGRDISGNSLPFAPAFTWSAICSYRMSFNKQYVLVPKIKVYGNSGYHYDAFNQSESGDYTLCDASLALEAGKWQIEVWTKNLFDAEYQPVAFASSMASSGYLAESGAPLTFGVTLKRSL